MEYLLGPNRSKINGPPLEYPLMWEEDPSGLRYQALFIENNLKPNRCVLFLSGTSTQISDVHFFIKKLYETGHSVGSIERSIGGPFDIKIIPKIERKIALKDFIFKLNTNKKIDEIVVIAHSYAALELINLMVESPLIYKKIIKEIFLVNPAGFSQKRKFFGHCFKFLFNFICREYLFLIKKIFYCKKLSKNQSDFISKKLKLITSLFLKTISNPVRTFREVNDIVSSSLEQALEILIKKYRFKFRFVINNGDSLLSSSEILESANKLLYKRNIMVFSGNHMDLLINDKQIESVLTQINCDLEK